MLMLLSISEEKKGVRFALYNRLVFCAVRGWG